MEKIGRYEIMEETGRGGMGIVYKAHDPMIGRSVCIKLISLPNHIKGKKREDVLRRFRREAQAAGRLSHPNILTIYDVGEDNGLPFIAMELLSGKTLEKHLEEKGRLSIEEAKGILAQACNGLEFAHSHGVVHRDIKPSNIFLMDSGQVKVMDFGIAILPDSEATDTSHILGSPSYIAPEYVRGDTVDHRADIFSLGVVLYQILTGEKPFRGENMAAILQKIVAEDPVPPSQLRPSLPGGCDIVSLKALQKDPAKRYQRATEMARDFSGVEELRSRAGMSLEVKAAPVHIENDYPSQTERIFKEVTTTARRSKGRIPLGFWSWLKSYFG